MSTEKIITQVAHTILDKLMKSEPYQKIMQQVLMTHIEKGFVTDKDIEDIVIKHLEISTPKEDSKLITDI